jgi:polyhydroxybutyrate depolymerase
LREALVFALFLAAACGRKTTPATKPASEAPSARLGATPSVSVPASAPRIENFGLGKAVVHVPPELGANEKVPLVLILHGLGSSSGAIERATDIAKFAAEKRFAWVAPDGSRDTIGRQYWNAGGTCCDFDEASVDHVSALRSFVTKTIAERPIDPKRVYFVGHSNGGFMAHRIACELGDLVAGVVSISGAGPKPAEPCPASGSVRVLEVHGDADVIVNIDGGPLFADARYPASVSAAQTMSDWAKRYECKPAPKAAGTLDFDPKLPGEETRVTRFEGCKRGAVELWTVVGGDHYVGFRSPPFEAIWKFLSSP